MKTIKQIADEIGVSKQAVQKRISREPLCTQIQPYIHTEQGTKYIDENGENLIITAFSDKVYTTVADNVPTDKPDRVDTLISMLQEQLQAKDKLIGEQQQSIHELTAALENTTASLHAAQALHAGTMSKQLTSGRADQDEPTEAADKPKKSFLDRIFRK